MGNRDGSYHIGVVQIKNHIDDTLIEPPFLYKKESPKALLDRSK